MTLKIFGYAGCTTVKKAVSWAQESKLEPEYTHFNKVDSLKTHLENWVEIAGIDKVFNAKAQTFKKLPEDKQLEITKDTGSKIDAMAADPRFIKRPIGTNGDIVLTGFQLEDWEREFN